MSLYRLYTASPPTLSFTHLMIQRSQVSSGFLVLHPRLDYSFLSGNHSIPFPSRASGTLVNVLSHLRWSFVLLRFSDTRKQSRRRETMWRTNHHFTEVLKRTVQLLLLLLRKRILCECRNTESFDRHMGS